MTELSKKMNEKVNNLEEICNKDTKFQEQAFKPPQVNTTQPPPTPAQNIVPQIPQPPPLPSMTPQIQPIMNPLMSTAGSAISPGTTHAMQAVQAAQSAQVAANQAMRAASAAQSGTMGYPMMQYGGGSKKSKKKYLKALNKSKHKNKYFI